MNPEFDQFKVAICVDPSRSCIEDASCTENTQRNGEGSW